MINAVNYIKVLSNICLISNNLFLTINSIVYKFMSYLHANTAVQNH